MRLYLLIILFSFTSFAGNDFDKHSFLDKIKVVQRNLLACRNKVNESLGSSKKLKYSQTVWSYENPTVYSWTILEDQFESSYDRLDGKLKNIAQTGLLEECTLKILKDNWKSLENIEMAERTSLRLLRKESSDAYLVHRWADLRGYLNLKKKVDSKKIDLNSSIKNIDSATKKQLLDMCRNFEKTIEECAEHWKGFEDDSLSLGDVYSILKPRSQALFADFLKVDPNNLALNVVATKTKSTLKLTVPMNLEVLGLQKDAFIEIIRAYWNVSGLEIEILNSKDPMVPFIKLNDNRANYVHFDNPKEMGLQEDFLYDPYSYADVVAHEFGHILGFVDCYLEFYEDDNKTIVSYPLDPNNIMCGGSSYKVTRSHVKALEQAYNKN